MNGCLILCLLVATLSRGDFELEVRYAALLRERGLFRLSELQCQQLLGRSDLDRAAASQATIELSKSLAAHALNSHPPERGQLWQRATTVIDEALAVDADHPSRILLQTQKGLTVLLQAEWSRREAEVKARDDADWKLARDQLGSAISQLQEVANELDPAKRTGKSAEPLPPARRESLRRNVHHQLARAYRNHALTYADRSPDRVNSLTRALDHLKLLDASSGVDQLAWQSRLDRIGTFRLLKEFEKAKQLIVELQANELPAVFAASLATESVRLFLAAGRPDVAARLADDFAERSTHQARSNPEFELARIETLVARAQQADEKQQVAQPLEDRAISLATSLGERHGTYWGLRGRMLISRLAEQSAGNGNVELLKIAAESYMQRDLPEDAAETFIQAARQAEQDGNVAKAFDFRKRAAAVDHQSGNLRAAIDRLRDAALKHPTQPEAASTHLLGAFDAAALYQQQVASGTGPQRPARTLDQYRALLEEHLAHWPAAETADQARLWRGRLHEAEGNWEDALHDYQAIKPTSAQSVTRYDRLRGIYEKVLVGSDAETTVRLKEARQWLDAQAQSALAGEGNLQAARALLEAARLRLFHDPTDYPAADANLEEALSLVDRGSPQARELRALAVVAAAGRTGRQHGQSL